MHLNQVLSGRMCGNRDHTTIIHHVRLKRNRSTCALEYLKGKWNRTVVRLWQT